MKKILIQNQNNKLACGHFSHITFAPPEGVLKQSQLPIPILVDAGTDIVETNLIALAVIKLREVSSIDTYLAFGIDRTQFMTKFLNDNPGTDADTRIGVYIYQKLTNNVDNQHQTPGNS